MRRFAALLLALAAVAAAVEILRRRRTTDAAESARDPRADALRQKLARTRDPASPAAAPEAVSVPATEQAPAPAATPDEARRLVHAEARAAIDEMRRAGDAVRR